MPSCIAHRPAESIACCARPVRSVLVFFFSPPDLKLTTVVNLKSGNKEILETQTQHRKAKLGIVEGEIDGGAVGEIVGAMDGATDGY